MDIDKFGAWLMSVLFRPLFKSREEGQDSTRDNPADPAAPFSDTDDQSELLTRRTLSVSEKGSKLREILHFSQGTESELEAAASIKDIATFFGEVFLSRFKMVQEIGLLNPEAVATLERISQALEHVQTKQEFSGNLVQENETLKKKLEELEAHYLSRGIVTDRELHLEKEISSLRRRERELKLQLDRENKKVEALRPIQELAKTLYTKNSLLNAKHQHQAGLMQALITDNQKYQDLTAKAESFKDENMALKMELEEKPGLFDRLKSLFTADSPTNQPLEELIKKHDSLESEIVEKGFVVENMLQSSGSDLVDTVDSLEEQNVVLKRLIQSRAELDGLAKEHEAGERSYDKIIQHLEAENQDLKQTIISRQEKIDVFEADPAQQRLMKALVQMRHENSQLSMQLKSSSQLVEQLEDEKKVFLPKLHDHRLLLKENSQLKTRVQYLKQLGESSTQLEAKYKSLKKNNSALNKDNQVLTAENQILKKKLDKVSGEYKALIKEYESIFQGH
ncbi:MAG: hypothetical protein HQK60_19650 [Deltaproteobacteria bacterium]|nr:hypothetical protein [Deltaproteobacteria bacterium]